MRCEKRCEWGWRECFEVWSIKKKLFSEGNECGGERKVRRTRR